MVNAVVTQPLQQIVVIFMHHACNVVCYGTVKHSQKLSANPHQTWVAVEKEGLVICAHCNCMAGLWEACSHVAALLFLLDAI